jgi:hypothetical protein
MAAHEHTGPANGWWKNLITFVTARYEANEDMNPRTMTKNKSVLYLPEYQDRY